MLKSIFNTAVKAAVVIAAVKVASTVIAPLHMAGKQIEMAGMTMAGIFFMSMEEARYQDEVWCRTFYGHNFLAADEKAAKILEKDATASEPNIIVKDRKKEVTPSLAAEMVAVLRELARRVMEGTAPVGELMSMVETVQRMGIDVMDCMVVPGAFAKQALQSEKAA